MEDFWVGEKEADYIFEDYELNEIDDVLQTENDFLFKKQENALHQEQEDIEELDCFNVSLLKQDKNARNDNLHIFYPKIPPEPLPHDVIHHPAQFMMKTQVTATKENKFGL